MYIESYVHDTQPKHTHHTPLITNTLVTHTCTHTQLVYHIHTPHSLTHHPHYTHSLIPSSPHIGEGGVAESITKREHWCASIELVCASRRVPHAHVEEGDLVDIISWILREGYMYVEEEGTDYPITNQTDVSKILILYPI